MRSAPGFATWLLTHFGSSPNNDALLGDLIERYGQGLTRTWYWKQCLKAIVGDIFNQCRAHKLLTVRAMIMGWAVLFLYFQTFEPVRDLFAAFQSWSRWWRHDWLLLPFFTLDAILFCFAAGWLIARFHRPHHVPLVLIFTISSCCVAWTWFVIAISYSVRFIWPPNLFFAVLTNLLVPITILAGGGLFRRHATK